MPTLVPKSRAFQLMGSLACLLALAACSIAPATPQPTPSPSPLRAPTVPLQELLPTLAATTAPTPTSTPAPTGTPALPPGLGELLLSESFENNSAGWPVTSGPAGAVSVAEGSLVIALRQPRTSLLSLYPQPVPLDFYLQARATTTLCDLGKNEFGFVFRASPLHQYRAAFSCDGTLRFERYHGLEMEGASLWQPTLSLLRGAPAENQIGLRASGARFSLYANNQMVFTFVDSFLTAGEVGLFASTDQSSVLSVAFRDLKLWAAQGESVAPTLQP